MINIKEQKGNLIFLTFIILMFVYFIISYAQSSRQREVFLEENQIYQNANYLIKQGQYGEAEPLLDQLMITHNNNYIVLWNYAVSLFGQGDLNGAKNYYEKASEQRPFLRKNANFVAQYGQVLYNLQQYEEAKNWLVDAQKLDPKLTGELQPILKDIEIKIEQK